MTKTTSLFFLIACAALGGCTPTYNRSIVLERPNQSIKEVLIVIEQPSFSGAARERDGVLKIDNMSKSVVDRYQYGFYRAIRNDFVRVMADNGIQSGLKFVPPVLDAGPAALNVLSPEERNRWHYVLWIRHVKGMYQCQYGSCEAYFQTEARLFDTRSTRALWSAQDTGGTFYGEKVWSDGRMYKSLLDRLNTDGMISLPGSGAKIKVGGATNK